ncbi:MAG TPA: isoamylase early set domain-containing protein [Candidatus Limnocylindria bacterium]|jgi:1,4-alpha-glucan branching enzyme|nr:isoamylase early set domain-containing protein [Candidatus Limnocylindria bacterium]
MQRGSLYKSAATPISFICLAPSAKVVSVIGEFNNWDPAANPMEKNVDGSWRGMIQLKHGHHQYAFLVDGVVTLDPRGQGVSRNPRGERVSLLAVS